MPSCISPLSGKPAAADMRVKSARLVAAYDAKRPDPTLPEERVVFITPGHRYSRQPPRTHWPPPSPALAVASALQQVLAPNGISQISMAQAMVDAVIGLP